jgi:hypothetical protein
VTVADEPPPQKEWDLPLRWVVIAGVGLWLLAAGGLLLYLLGPRVSP